MTQGGDEGQWWPREMVTKRSGDLGKWWRREVVTKGSGDFGKWWGREVLTKGVWWFWEVVTKGVWWLWEVVRTGVWWPWEMVTKGSGDEGKWWGREVVTKGSGDEGKWWWREVVTKGSGEERKWWLREVMTKRREVVTKGSGDEGNAEKCIVMAAWMLHALCCGEEAGARNLVFFRVKWLQPAMKGTSCVRRFLLCVLQRVVVLCVPVCVVLFVSWICGCRSHWNGCMNVARSALWGGSRSTKPCVSCKVAAAGVQRYLMCAAVAAGLVLVPPLCSATSGCSCVPVCVVLCVSWICGCRSH